VYYESQDGKFWTRPSLGVRGYGATKDTNILMEGAPQSVFVDPHGDADERYKAVWHADYDLDTFAADWKGQKPYTQMALETAPGTKLFINAVTQLAGHILVEVADYNRNALPGRSFDDAIPIRGDSYLTQVTWKNATDLGVEKGTPVMLRFRLDHAKIYFLEFR